MDIAGPGMRNDSYYGVHSQQVILVAQSYGLGSVWHLNFIFGLLVAVAGDSLGLGDYSYIHYVCRMPLWASRVLEAC